jgi:hypothetical protein
MREERGGREKKKRKLFLNTSNSLKEKINLCFVDYQTTILPHQGIWDAAMCCYMP